MKESQRFCSFCGKPEELVKKLIAGQNGAFICDECVEICKDMLSETEQSSSTQPVPLKKPSEIKEELDTEIEVGELIETVEYDYPKFHLTMHCFMCTVKSGHLVLKEHEAAKWLTKDTLDSVDWLPADEGIIDKIKQTL